MGKFIQDRMVKVKRPEGPIRAWLAGKDTAIEGGKLRATLPPLSITVFHNIEP